MKPGYKKTELGEIPEEWEVKRLGEIVDIYDYKRIPLKELDRFKMKGEYPYCGANGIIDYIDKYIFDGEYILLAEDGGDFGQYEKKAFIMVGKFWANNHVHILKAKKNVLNKYLLYYLNYTNLYNYIVGTTRTKLNQEMLRNILILFPNNLPEQQKIAEILSTVDETIEMCDKKIEKLEKFKKGMMHKLLTKGIGHKKFKKTELGEIPVEWEVKRLGDIVQDMFYGVTAKKVEEDNTDNKSLKMLRTTDIKDYKVTWENLPLCEITEKRDDIGKYILKKDDIIISRAGTVGISVLVEKVFNNIIFGSYLIKIKLKSNIFPKFIHYFLQTERYWSYIKQTAGSTLKNINLPFLKNLTISIPPLTEQQKIAEILSSIDDKIEIEKQRKQKLEILKKGLMNDLLTGRKRVKI